MNMTNRNENQIMVRKLFNTDVNIADYDTLHSSYVDRKQSNAKFLKFTWIDISERTKNDEDLENIFIREAQNDRSENIRDLSISVRRGWNTSFFPPCYGTDGRFRDGRSRVITALESGEKWMIVALYDYIEGKFPTRNYVTNSLIANSEHSPAELNKMKDFIEAGVELILMGELANDRASISEWLYNECSIENRWPGNNGGHITKIIDSILVRAKEGLNGATIRKKDDKEWLDWISNAITKNAVHWNTEYNVSDVSDIVFHKTGRGSAERILTRHVLSNASKGKITNIVLYAGGTRDDMIKDHIAFEDALQELYCQTYKWINHEVRGVELKHDTNSPMWKIIGVIPQFLNDEEHETCYKKGYLIPMNKIRKLHPLNIVLNNVLPFATAS
jgi:hypothetical protein